MTLNILNEPVRNRKDVSFHINRNYFKWLFIQIHFTFFTFTTIIIKFEFQSFNNWSTLFWVLLISNWD